MSDRIITGIRLLRAVFMAQRAVDEMNGRGKEADAEWWRRNEALTAAKRALDAFEASTETRLQAEAGRGVTLPPDRLPKGTRLELIVLLKRCQQLEAAGVPVSRSGLKAVQRVIRYLAAVPAEGLKR